MCWIMVMLMNMDGMLFGRYSNLHVHFFTVWSLFDVVCDLFLKQKLEVINIYNIGGFLKWWYPTTMSFPTQNDHFVVLCGYHHLRKHPYIHFDAQVCCNWWFSFQTTNPLFGTTFPPTFPTSVGSDKNLPLLPPLHGTDTGIEAYHVSAHLVGRMGCFFQEKGLYWGSSNWDGGFYGNKMAVS